MTPAQIDAQMRGDYDKVADDFALENPAIYKAVSGLFERYDAGAVSMCAGQTDPSTFATMPLLYRKWKREKAV